MVSGNNFSTSNSVAEKPYLQESGLFVDVAPFFLRRDVNFMCTLDNLTAPDVFKMSLSLEINNEI